MQKTTIKKVQKSLIKNLQNIEENKIDLQKAKTINTTCNFLIRATIVDIYLNKPSKLK
jgi:hypothetical protein